MEDLNFFQILIRMNVTYKILQISYSSLEPKCPVLFPVTILLATAMPSFLSASKTCSGYGEILCPCQSPLESFVNPLDEFIFSF